MPQYQAKAQLYVGGRLIAPGEKFESNDPAGLQWEPLDDAARAAVSARPTTVRGGRGKPAPKVAAAAKAPVDIPEDWRDLNPEQRINLARSLGAPVKGTKAKQADAFIESEAEKRAAAAAEAAEQ